MHTFWISPWCLLYQSYHTYTSVVSFGDGVKFLLTRCVPQHQPHILSVHPEKKETNNYIFQLGWSRSAKSCSNTHEKNRTCNFEEILFARITSLYTSDHRSVSLGIYLHSWHSLPVQQRMRNNRRKTHVVLYKCTCKNHMRMIQFNINWIIVLCAFEWLKPGWIVPRHGS